MRTFIYLLFIFLHSCNSNSYYYMDVSDTQVGILIDELSYKLLSEEYYSSGTFKVKKGNKLILYELKEQTLYSTFKVSNSNDSLFNISIELSYYLVKDSVMSIHNRYGESYQTNFIEPEVKSIVRELSQKNIDLSDRATQIIDSMLTNRGFMLTKFRLIDKI